ncbi:MAG: hypothetical protein IPK15_21490 [Verrucomicrobia bacterium]|nr:hypothetical protein [Verrucomicrobiota bacterium]
MTTYANNADTCGACGHVFTHPVLMSTNAFGSADLDTRPPEMQRSTMEVWVTRCPSCGYCARRISVCDDRQRPVLESAAYRSQLADRDYPELASTFLCQAMLLAAVDEPHQAAWSRLHAAWVLEDAEKSEQARQWRGRAADEFLAIPLASRPQDEPAGAYEAVVVDCLRRAGRGDEALAWLDRLSGQDIGGVIQKVLLFQRVLIQRADIDRHRISEALAP